MRKVTGKVRVGTSGYQYPDWVGPFYPPGTRPEGMLAWYARIFDVVELNSSYYGLPREKTTRRLAQETPPAFRAYVKAYKGMTHKFEGWEAYDQFRKAMDPLIEAGKLGGILFQFPPWFRNDARHRRYLDRLPGILPGIPLIVEFRSPDWIVEETFRQLESLKIQYSCVDEPDLPELVPRIARVTGGQGYLRFHSRDGTKWHGGGGGRYDYDYSDAELSEWIEKILPLLESVGEFVVFFNNCKRSAAVENARRFKALLEERGVP